MLGTIFVKKIFLSNHKQYRNALKVVMNALKIRFEISKEDPYDPLFVAKVMESRQQVREGKTKKMELSAIWN